MSEHLTRQNIIFPNNNKKRNSNFEWFYALDFSDMDVLNKDSEFREFLKNNKDTFHISNNITDCINVVLKSEETYHNFVRILKRLKLK